ncbi:hypothetical protein SAMN04488062_1045 [Flavobacterium omnivorum]|uniref:Uncharacterized protein n=1 Tax=Flavobacterium omnivorum TaxID=178355 RepID=A0A1G7ZD34_9FLAO|nr:hypothetical protein [Flavobacterium omnivorum]SDH05990.1 hypothetical protein SAMN04488062_1045 [Flavobacterium omnivorum]
MTKIINKWYISLVIAPIITTYLTNFFILPKLFSDWKLAIIFSLTILTITLLIELKLLSESHNIPNESDKRIIKRLLKKLDIKSFQEEICMNDSWNGYKQDSIHKIIKYQHAVKLIKNKTVDKKLQQMIDIFNYKLDLFTDFTAQNVYGGNSGFLIPFKNSEDRNSVKKDSEKMNILAKNAFAELENLVEYLKSKKYI